MLDTLHDLGWFVKQNFLTESEIEQIRTITLTAQRGQDLEGKYWYKNSGAAQPSLSLWWAGQLLDHPLLETARQKVLAHSSRYRSEWQIYSVDIITNEPTNRLVFPHVDSPYRFESWADSKELLALQYIIPLQSVDQQNGATALVPQSWRYTWPIDSCYAHKFDEFFLANCEQPKLGPGDCLIYHPNMLHSAMPNHSTSSRLALLISVTDPQLIKRLKFVDNVWTD